MKLKAELSRDEIEIAVSEYIARHLNGTSTKVVFLLREICDYYDKPSGQYDLKGAEVEYES